MRCSKYITVLTTPYDTRPGKRGRARENCAYMYTGDGGKWRDVRCFETVREEDTANWGYICEKPAYVKKGMYNVYNTIQFHSR